MTRTQHIQRVVVKEPQDSNSRLLVVGSNPGDGHFTRLALLRFGRDGSVYLFPQSISEIIVETTAASGETSSFVEPGDRGYHISFHHSGDVHVRRNNGDLASVAAGNLPPSGVPIFTTVFVSQDAFERHPIDANFDIMVCASGYAEDSIVMSVFRECTAPMELYCYTSANDVFQWVIEMRDGSAYVFECFRSPARNLAARGARLAVSAGFPLIEPHLLRN